MIDAISRPMKTLSACLLLQVAALHAQAGSPQAHSAESEQSFVVSPRLHISEQAAFLHLVDTLSRWSPYCSSVDHGFLGLPELVASDTPWLERYAAARRPMGGDAETGLFLWAESGFPLEGRSPGHRELRAAVDHFWGNSDFRDPLAKRMKELERFRPSLEQEIARLHAQMATLRGVVDVFRNEEATHGKDIPIFVMYALQRRGSQGGANGDGLYTEVEPAAASEGAFRGTHLLHEYLHVALRPRKLLRDYAGSQPRMKAWQQALSSKAPDERGDDEAAMLDEILVHALANVVVEGRDPEGQIRNYAKGGDKQRVRLWDGVRILLPMIGRQLEKPVASGEFLSQLIGTFVSRVQHGAWSPPEGITIAAKPS